MGDFEKIKRYDVNKKSVVVAILLSTLWLGLGDLYLKNNKEGWIWIIANLFMLIIFFPLCIIAWVISIFRMVSLCKQYNLKLIEDMK